MHDEEKLILTWGNIGHSPPDLPASLNREHTELYSVPKVADKQPLTTVVKCKLTV